MAQFIDPTFTPLFSGLAGALIGVSSAWMIARWQARERTFIELRKLMLSIGRDLYRQQSNLPYSILDARYDDILNAIWEAHRYTFVPANKREILRLGYSLIGHKTVTRHRHCHAYPNLAEALRATERILAFVGCPYDYRFGPEDDAPKQTD